MELNQKLFSYFYGFAHRYEALDAIIVYLATDFGLIVIFALVYFLYTHEDRRRGLREFLIVSGSAVAAWLIAHVIKYFYPVARPDTFINTVIPLFAHGNGFDSFPSGHATFYSALAAAMYFYHRKIAYALAVVALLIGLARVMSGVHSPLDILAGFALGVFVAVIAHIFLTGR